MFILSPQKCKDRLSSAIPLNLKQRNSHSKKTRTISNRKREKQQITQVLIDFDILFTHPSRKILSLAHESILA